MTDELTTDLSVHHDEPFLRMSRLRLQELRTALRGLLGEYDMADDLRAKLTPSATPMKEGRFECVVKSPAPVSATRVPDGWKLVPIQPTEAMLDRAEQACFADVKRKEAFKHLKAQWREMLAASPLYVGGK